MDNLDKKARRKLSRELRKTAALNGERVRQVKAYKQFVIATKAVTKRNKLSAMLGTEFAVDARKEQKRLRTYDHGAAMSVNGFYNGNMAKGRKTVTNVPVSAYTGYFA